MSVTHKHTNAHSAMLSSHASKFFTHSKYENVY